MTQQKLLRNALIFCFAFFFTSIVFAQSSLQLQHHNQGQHAQKKNFYYHFMSLAHRCGDLSNLAINISYQAYRDARRLGYDKKQVYSMVDFTRPSFKKRICTIDLANNKVLYRGLVANGIKSGLIHTRYFSNKMNSYESSLGLYTTGKTYYGHFGYALRIHGLNKGLDSNAARRHVIVHGSKYVNNITIKEYGEIGPSGGCFALNKQFTRREINFIKGGTLIFAYYPKQKLLRDYTNIKPNVG